MKTSLFFITGIFVVTSAFAYSVKKGDSLSGIAEEHLGDWGKWKTIWNANKELIRNPDLIYPGQKISMDKNIPNNKRLLVASSENNLLPVSKSGRSQEWRLLPEQSWEKFVFRKNPETDPDGFDRRSKVAKKVSDKTNPSVTVSTDRIAIEGEIINARTEYGQIFLGEQVFIRPEEQLQVGMTYSISSGPQKLISKRNNRVGFAYDLAGKVKIIGVRDGLFIGTIISAQKPIYRNNLLIPEVKPHYFPKAIPSVDVLVASILTTDFLSSSLLGEQQLVILDVGSNEGVKTGMIFRNYLKKDPNTQENITTRDYLIESEIQVLDVKDQFSIGIILQSRSILHSDDLVLSLMDLKDFQKNVGMQTFIQDYDYTAPLDNLDQLDDSQGLGSKEDQELRQLEKVDPKAYEGAPELGDEPAPNDLVDKTINIKPPEKVETPNTAPAPEDNALAPPKEEPVKVESPTDAELDLAPPTDLPAATPAPVVTPTPTPAPKATPSENDLPADLAIPPDVPMEAPKK